MTPTNDNLRVTNLFNDLIEAFDLDALFIDGISKKGKRVTAEFGDLRSLGRDRYETRHDVSGGPQVAAAAEIRRPDANMVTTRACGSTEMCRLGDDIKAA